MGATWHRFRPWLGLLFLLTKPEIVTAQTSDPQVSAVTSMPDMSSSNQLHMRLADVKGFWQSGYYTLVPAANSTNSTQRPESTINGNLVSVDTTNYNKLNTSTDVAYVSCDPVKSGFLTTNDVLKNLVNSRPVAIVLYTTSKDWCQVSGNVFAGYHNLLSMVDSGDSKTVSEALGHFEGIEDEVHVTIVANTTADRLNNEENQHDAPVSNVAVIVLYCIAGLITGVFLLVIAFGAIRAHRHPERYGPRGASNNRPRQSRARGLARAVLDTIPIVKFGDHSPPKSEQELELGSVPSGQRDTAATTVASSSNDVQSHRPADVKQPEAVQEEGIEPAANLTPPPDTSAEDNVGCSICTEDFENGEDVRVLPCGHQYHPPCVDPWLVKVSGTCPMCRMDLRPGHQQKNAANSQATDGEGSQLPPPLALEDDARPAVHGILPVQVNPNQLRMATRQEQLATLRTLRQQQFAARRQSTASALEGEAAEARRGARFAARLRETFHIRTREQS